MAYQKVETTTNLILEKVVLASILFSPADFVQIKNSCLEKYIIGYFGLICGVFQDPLLGNFIELVCQFPFKLKNYW